MDDKQLLVDAARLNVISGRVAEQICGHRLDKRHTWLLVDGSVYREIYTPNGQALLPATVANRESVS